MVPQDLSSFPNASVPPWLSVGSNSWELTAATLVSLMSIPGLALLYAGLVKRKHVVNAMYLSFYTFAAVMVTWILIAYPLAFGYPALVSLRLGETSYAFLGSPAPYFSGTLLGSQGFYGPSDSPLNIPVATFMLFQFSFAAITPMLVLGGILERVSTKAWMIVVPLWTILVYSPLAYWLFAGGWLNQMGAVDYSGGYVVEEASGFAALAAALAVGPREPEEMRIEGNNLTLVALGAGLIWVGWFGFNGGDPYGATINASIAIVNTNLAGAVGALVWTVMDYKDFGKPSLIGLATGAIVGLVAISPAAGYVNAMGAVAIGLISTLVSRYALYKLQPKLKVDDTLGIFPAHGIPGLVGGILTGVFADPSVTRFVDPGLRGALYGDPWQVAIQTFAGAVVGVYSFVMTFVIFKLVSLITPLKEEREKLMIGDLEMHGEVAYFILNSEPAQKSKIKAEEAEES